MRKDGGWIDISLTISPMRDAGGKIIGASKIARDITEQKRSEAQIAILAREAEHRAKNLLTTVQATVHLTQADTLEGFKHAIAGRIQALANVNSLFVQSRWKGAELRSLVTQELAPYYENEGTRVQIAGPDLLLEPSTAQTIAIILHELATNAAKFGALSTLEGRVQIEWSRSLDQLLILRWIETDGPLVKPPTHYDYGFGTRVMENMIRGQLKGEMCFDWRPEGLACEVAIPA
jgi:two-component sensor histidine kinase